MNLIIDIGNTVAKFVIFDENQPICEERTSNESFMDVLDLMICKWKPTKAILSSVAGDTCLIQQKLENYKIPFLVVNSATLLPVSLGRKISKTLGSDRLAAVVGATMLCSGKNILVIDAGTCITYEFIDNQGYYHGGCISPGLDMRLKALHEHTAKLPLVEIKNCSSLVGTDTLSSIASGVMNSIKFEIEGYIRLFRNKYPDISIFLTGGNTLNFDSSLKSCIFADKYLVPRGLNRILQYNDI